MNLHGQINAACESKPGHPQPCHWSVWIVLECGFHVKMDFNSCGIMPGSVTIVSFKCYQELISCQRPEVQIPSLFSI